jgi:peptidyl-prolyl isomerase D
VHALTHPLESVRYLDLHHGSVEPAALATQYDDVLVPVLLNSALVALKLGTAADARSAIGYTTRVLGISGRPAADQAKALYRRGLAHVAVKDDGAAEADLVRAAELVPEDAAIKAELTRVRDARKAKRDAEKKKFKKMFA